MPGAPKANVTKYSSQTTQTTQTTQTSALALCCFYDESTMYALRWDKANIPLPVDGQRNGKRRGPSSGGTQGESVVIWAQGIPFISVLADYYALVFSHLRRYRWQPTKKVSHPPRKFDLRLKFSWHHGPPCEGAGYQTISQRQYILEACNWLEPTMFLSRLHPRLTFLC